MITTGRSLPELLQELKSIPFSKRRQWLHALEPFERQLMDGWMLLSIGPLLLPGSSLKQRMEACGKRVIDGIVDGLEPRGSKAQAD